MNLKFTAYRYLQRVLITVFLLSGSAAMAGVTVERQTTFTDDNGGRAVTIAQGEFQRPGGEFNVNATFNDFQPDTDGPIINGEINAVSSVTGNPGLFVRKASRTTIFNGRVSLTNLPRGEQDVSLELVDLSITDQRERRRGLSGNRADRENQWSGNVIINGNSFEPQELPRPAREMIGHIIGILRH